MTDDNMSRRQRFGVFLSMATLGLFLIVLITMYIITL